MGCLAKLTLDLVVRTLSQSQLLRPTSAPLFWKWKWDGNSRWWAGARASSRAACQTPRKQNLVFAVPTETSPKSYF